LKNDLRVAPASLLKMGQQHSSVCQFPVPTSVIALINRLPTTENIWTTRGTNYTIDKLIRLFKTTAHSYGWQCKQFGDIYAARLSQVCQVSSTETITFIVCMRDSDLRVNGQPMSVKKRACICRNGSVEVKGACQDYFVVLLEGETDLRV